MDVFEAITTARAVRRFSAEPVTTEEIRLCLDAAVCAPSGGNIQPWRFVVLTEAEPKAAVAEIYRRAYDRYEPALLGSLPPFRSEDEEASFRRSVAASRHLAEHLAEASALILVLMPAINLTLTDAGGPLDIGPPYASVYPAVQNIILAARAQGIGTTLTTVFRIYQADLRAAIGIPERFEVVAMLPLGRPKGPFSIPRRRPAATLTSWEHFGQQR